MTTWVEGYEGRYSVTREGEVRRHYKNGKIRRIGSQNVHGYIGTVLTYNGSEAPKLVHRLVAEAFIPNPDNLPMVDHIDEDKTNNHVDNLRWCTLEQNNKYYSTKDGRDHHTKLRAKHKARMKEMSKEIRAKIAELNSLQRQINKEHKKLKQAKERFDKMHARETAKLIQARKEYTGYKAVTGLKYASREAMVEATGKKIVVDGTQFNSCGAASKYIVDSEETNGIYRNKATISKELRRFVAGQKAPWTMYGRYTIGS